MDLKKIKDNELLLQIKEYVSDERRALVCILAHLREIERRRLYSERGFKSLFDYAVGELSYSEDQAARRIQAMRLIKDVPEVEHKIASGELSLSNAHQVQTLFRNLEQKESDRMMTKVEKLKVLASVEHKSRREAERVLIKWQPQAALPKERERIVANDISEVRFLLSEKLKAKLEAVRSLLGPRGVGLGYAELFEEMSDLSLQALKTKRFGKNRTNRVGSKKAVTLQPVQQSNNPRYISKAMKHQIWERDRGSCTRCGGQRNLNYDHIRPVALGGKSESENLRLLCFACNQRASTKIFRKIYEAGAKKYNLGRTIHDPS